MEEKGKNKTGNFNFCECFFLLNTTGKREFFVVISIRITQVTRLSTSVMYKQKKMKFSLEGGKKVLSILKEKREEGDNMKSVQYTASKISGVSFFFTSALIFAATQPISFPMHCPLPPRSPGVFYSILRRMVFFHPGQTVVHHPEPISHSCAMSVCPLSFLYASLQRLDSWSGVGQPRGWKRVEPLSIRPRSEPCAEGHFRTARPLPAVDASQVEKERVCGESRSATGRQEKVLLLPGQRVDQ